MYLYFHLFSIINNKIIKLLYIVSLIPCYRCCSILISCSTFTKHLMLSSSPELYKSLQWVIHVNKHICVHWHSFLFSNKPCFNILSVAIDSVMLSSNPVLYKSLQWVIHVNKHICVHWHSFLFSNKPCFNILSVAIDSVRMW